MIRQVFAALVLAGLTAASSPAQDSHEPPAEVAVISAMHGFHRDHPGYDYEAFYALVASYDPDLVGVEIRAEDMSRPGDYLARNYPAEMIALAETYGEQSFGFDWLGAELEGRAVPENWWAEQSALKALERTYSGDAAFSDPEGDALDARQMEILSEATPESLHDGRYDAVTREKYARLRERLAGTVYAPLAEFYAERDRRISEAVLETVLTRPGETIVVVTGADHRAAVIDRLAAEPRVRLLPVPPTRN